MKGAIPLAPALPMVPAVFARPRFAVLGAAAIFGPLPQLEPLVDGIGLFPGPPTILAGHGFSMKTLAAQSLAMCVAAGRSVWGRYETKKQRRVLHVDGEQGDRVTRERYQRLALGLGITCEELVDHLGVVIGNDDLVQLDAASAKETYLRELDGYDVALLDSFRALTPSADENKSDVRRYIDLLATVSEKTKTAILLIHHARKDGEGADRASLRGSSAIFDAAGAVYTFSRKEKSAPVVVRHEKDRVTGILRSDILLTATDVSAVSPDALPGLVVTASDHSASAPTAADKRSEAMATRKRAIVLLLAQAGPPLTKNAIARQVTGERQAILAAVDELARDGVLMNVDGKFVLAERGGEGDGTGEHLGVVGNRNEHDTKEIGHV